MKRLAIYTAVVLSTLVVAMVLWELREAAVLFFFSLGLAAAVRPLIDHMAQSGLPRYIGLVGTYLVGLAVLGVLIFMIGTLLVGEMHRFSEDSVAVYERIADQWPSGAWLQQAIARRIPPPDDLYQALSGQQATALMESILGTAYGLAETLVNVVVIIVLSIYWAIDRVHFERLWLSLLPVHLRSPSRDTWRAMEEEVGAYFRSEVVQSLIAGIVLGLGYAAIGLRYPALLAVVAAVAWMIPWAGAFVVVAAVLLLAFPNFLLEGQIPATLLSILAVLYTMLVLLFLEFFVEPKFFDRRRYNSLLMALAVIALAERLGILGLLLGPPLALALEILGERLLRQSIAPGAVTAEQPSVAIREHLAELQTELAATETPAPEITSLLSRLDSLAESARDIVPDLPTILPPAQPPTNSEAVPAV